MRDLVQSNPHADKVIQKSTSYLTLLKKKKKAMFRHEGNENYQLHCSVQKNWEYLLFDYSGVKFYTVTYKRASAFDDQITIIIIFWFPVRRESDWA